MHWDAVAAVGEILGAVAVLTTLGYLSVQVRQANRAARSAAARELRDSTAEIMRSISSNTELFEIYYDGMNNPSTLDRKQQLRFDTVILQIMRALESQYIEHRAGNLDDEMLASIAENALLVLRTPGGIQSWHRQERLLSHSFREWASAQLR